MSSSRLVVEDLRKIISSYKKGLQQLYILDSQINDLELRLQRAEYSHHHCVQRSLKLRLCVLEQTRNTYYFYVQKKCQQFNTVRIHEGFKSYRTEL